MAAGGTAAALAGACLDGCDAAAFLDERAGVEEQLVRIGDVLNIEELHERVALLVEVLVHILQHVLNAYLLAVADAPDTVELETFDDGALQNEDGRGAGAADEVHALGGEARDGLGEDAVVPACEQTDAVGAYEGAAVVLAGVQDALLQLCTLGGLLAEACGDDNEGADVLLACEEFYVVGTKTCGDNEDGQVRGRQLADIVEGFEALHLILFGVDDAQGSLEVAFEEVADDGAAGFLGVVGAADDSDALGG